MRLVSPVSGVVERVYVEKGEGVEALEKVIRVVRIDPLWVEVPVPLATARGLKEGSAATVRLSGSKGEAVQGKVVYVSSVADAAAETLTIRVEVENGSGHPAGQRVIVQFGAGADGPGT